MIKAFDDIFRLNKMTLKSERFFLSDLCFFIFFSKQHYKSIMQYINQGPLFLSVQMHQPDRTAHAYMDALQAFWPGLQVTFHPIRLIVILG